MPLTGNSEEAQRCCGTKEGDSSCPERLCRGHGDQRGQAATSLLSLVGSEATDNADLTTEEVGLVLLSVWGWLVGRGT